jgi:outer membrane protein OmpA-like peptidoglycan-associated protein
MRNPIPVLLALLLGLIVALPAYGQDGYGAEKIDARDNIGPAINTGSIEIMPIISPDGTTLYFDRKNDSANNGGVSDDDDIYYSTLQPDGSWSVARNIGPPLNTPGSDVLFWISPDGTTALVYNGTNLSNGRPMGLAITHHTSGVWSAPKQISIQGLDDLGDVFYAHISPDGRRLLLAIDADDTREENFDIFYAPALGVDLMKWGAPVDLGDVINTGKFEGAPFMAYDDRTLYFASSGHTGYGLSDLFVSRRLGESWMAWGHAVHLGGKVNTIGFEASISTDMQGEYIYISGEDDMGELSFGKSDIYRIKLPDSLRPTQVTLVSGTLSARNKGVVGLVRAESLTDRREMGSISSNADGRFTLSLPTGSRYKLTGWAQGFNETSETIDANRAGRMDVELNLTGTGRQTREKDTRSEMFAIPPTPPIHFEFASAELNDLSEAILQTTLEIYKTALNAGRDITIDLNGYADNIGTDRSNIDLSRRRAERVKQWLMEHGIEEDRIVIKGHGESHPVATNDTDEGRALNRRVEFAVEGVLVQKGAKVTKPK